MQGRSSDISRKGASVKVKNTPILLLLLYFMPLALLVVKITSFFGYADTSNVRNCRGAL